MGETEILSADLANLTNEEVARALMEAPKGTDLSLCALASRIIYTDNDPGRWARVCNLAKTLIAEQGLVGEYSERYAGLLIEEANGTRLMPPGTWSFGQVEELLTVAQGVIEALPDDHPRKARLAELRLYHGGQTALLAGEPGRAAVYYNASVAIATSPFSAGLSRYLAAYCRLDQALIYGGSVQEAYEAFWRENEAFLATLNRANETEFRWLGNVLCHRRRADWLAGNSARVRDEESFGVIAGLEPHAAFDDALTVLYAAYLLQRGGRHQLNAAYETARWLADKIDAEIEWRSLAFLLMAEIEEGRGEREKARATLEALLVLPPQGGHVARAIARRKLAELG